MKRVASDFAGRWAISRDIFHADQPPAGFRGFGTFKADGDGLTYHEVGTLNVQGVAPMHSERRYRWDKDMNVYFEDGRFFHTVPALGGQTQHWCDPDSYHVTYDFNAWPIWTAEWRVTGPRKEYRMVSQYRQA